MLAIVQAYEILSDPERRQAYDLELSKGESTAKTEYTHQYYRSEVDRRRMEYIRWKRQQEHEKWLYQFGVLSKVYKYQRKFSFVILMVGLMFSIDFFITITEGPYKMDDFGINSHGLAAVVIGESSFLTDESLYYEILAAETDEFYVHHSSIFNKTAFVSISGHGRHAIYRSMYMFNNFFSYLLILSSGLMIYTRKYSEWLLSLGILSYFLSLFLILLALNY